MAPSGQPEPVKNPWLALDPAGTRVAEADREIVDAHNRRVAGAFQVDVRLLPDPYVGDPAAPVVMLALNPGLGDGDLATHQDEAFVQRSMANLRCEPAPYPFYYLDPTVQSGGRVFWETKLRLVLAKVDRQRVARRLCCLQFMPYHSREFRPLRPPLPTLEYTKRLLVEALDRGALVLVLRSMRLWGDAVPALKTYDRVVALKNPRNLAVSPGNLADDGFDRVVEALS